ncbi:hypothetical protein LshimejAT787_2100340 [Lyophyllum shimeji]|uniref:Uncharacterized protein n=1 Tax=Lyophyllum shimeji TaxID=47721 RepID=A0A9P3Q151_LYOSH|nr:hypothetical protein LshimejAT787_2100340 [Lyophyllum shimeji]
MLIWPEADSSVGSPSPVGHRLIFRSSAFFNSDCNQTAAETSTSQRQCRSEWGSVASLASLVTPSRAVLTTW